MSKKFLGLICILYSFIFGYVILFDKLKNFLAPTIQIYIKLSLIPMFIIGLVLLFSKKIHYKFKITDLVLILPLILLITTGDGKLTTSFATNRSTNINIKRTVNGILPSEILENELNTISMYTLPDAPLILLLVNIIL